MPPTTPAVPTPLLEVSLAAEAGPGTRAVLLTPAETADAPPQPGPGAGEAGLDAEWVRRTGTTGSAGSVQTVPTPPGNGCPDAHAWLVGLGAATPRDWRTAGAALVRAADARAESDTEAGRSLLPGLALTLPAWAGAQEYAALALGAVAASHRYRVGSGPADRRIRTLSLTRDGARPTPELHRAVAHAQLTGRATGLARDLANAPADVADPAWLAGTGARVASAVPGLRATVRDHRWLHRAGFGGTLAVGGGSARPPRLLELSWQPGSDTEQHLVLVGKGVTFDTGGISIKPAEGMHWMRTDMSGGAAVIAALVAIARMRLPLRVTGLVPCAENHVSGSAYRPGDVVRHAGGTTSEVTNTDAEGRLVLADAMAYAAQSLRPTAMVDVATLTGAMKVALGLRTGGVFGTDAELTDAVRRAGERTGEQWWPMPLSSDHAEAVRSELADVRQAPPGPAAVTAALFLREFTAGLPWAHLDIAGPARAETDYDEVNAGGTGFGTRTLIELARSVCGYDAR